MPGSSGRPSTSSSLVGYSSSPQGIGYSPSTPASPASSGIPSFRSLRSFLPFGSNKNAANTSASFLSTSPNNRSPFGAFGSVRRSMTKDRERQTSLSNDAMGPPVIAIERSNSDSFPDDTTIIRESLSPSKIDKPLPSEPSPSPSSCEEKSVASPDLSTIIEADNSGVSKQTTVNSSPTATNRNAKSKQGHNNTHGDSIHECDEDTTAIDLSTTHLADQVRDAIREEDSLKDQWLNADKAAIIDGDEDPSVADATFNMDPVDRDLGDLPSPRSATKRLPIQTNSAPHKASPNLITPAFLASSASRLPRVRQASSFLPLFRSSNSLSPPPQLPIHLTPPSPATPKSSSSVIANGNGHNALKPSSPPLPSTSTPLRDRDGRRTPSLRVMDTTTTVVRDRASSISRIPARMRKRSMTLHEKFGRGRNEDVVRSGSSLSTYGKTTSRGGGGGAESGSSVNESGASSGPKMEWLGPRTAKAFRAAGLLDFDRETGSAVPRRGSGSFSGYGGASSPGPNGGGAGSSYGHNGLMESPTLTVSSGSRERDTPKSSISTASTSLADSFGYLGRDRSERDLNRDREHEREEMREMKEKHGIEMGALLGALSDSQRTVRVLREENSDLRDRLERFTVAVQANQELRQVCRDLQSECGNLKRDNVDLRKELAGLRALTHNWSGGGSNSGGMRTPTPRAASGSSPLARTLTSEVVHEEYDDTFIDHGSQVENHRHPHYDSPDIILPHPSPVSSKKRRLSNSSSIFPIPPSNMTLLLHEDVISTFGSVGDHHSQYGFSLPSPTQQQRRTHAQQQSSSQSNNDSPPVSYLNFVGNIPQPNSPVVSVGGGEISPSTANFSMVTGSPRSLFLRPEHEILLEDMESLDLGVRNGDRDGEGKVDGW